MEDSTAVVVDIDYTGHYGEHNSGYSTFIPDSEDAYVRRIAFDYLMEPLHTDENTIIRDWAIFNNKSLCFNAPEARGLENRPVPFSITREAARLVDYYYGNSHECGEYWGNDLDAEEVRTKNEALLEVYESYYPSDGSTDS